MPEQYNAKELSDYVRSRVPELKDQPDHLLVKYLFSRQPEFQQQPLLDSRKAASTSEFEANKPEHEKPPTSFMGGVKQVLDAPLDFGIGVEEAFGLDPMHPLSSLPSAVINAGKGFVNMATPRGAVEGVKNLVGMPARAVAKGGQAIRERNPTAMFQAIGEGYGTGKPLVEGATAAVKAGVEAIPGMVEGKGAQFTAQALRPRTREMKAVTEKIAPELAKREVPGLTGAAYDENIFKMAAADTTALHAAEDAIKPMTRLQGFSDYVLPKIDRTIQALEARKANGGALAPHDAVISGLTQLRDRVAGLGNNPLFSDVVEFRRNVDETLQEQGAFKQAGDPTQYAHKVAARSVGNVTRDAINSAQGSEGIKAANQNYHVSRSAADVVEDRQLGSVGRIDSPSGLDLVLGLGGYAVEGILGTVAITGLRRVTQSRGVRAGLSRLANAIEVPPPPAEAGLPKNWDAVVDETNKAKLKLTYDPGDRPALPGRLTPGERIKGTTLPDRPVTESMAEQGLRKQQEARDLLEQMRKNEKAKDVRATADEFRRVTNEQLGQQVDKASESKLKQSYGIKGQDQFSAPGSGLPAARQADLELWRGSKRTIPSSPQNLDRIATGVDTKQFRPEDYHKMQQISQDIDATKAAGAEDPIQMLDGLVGGPEMRARLLSRPQGRNVIHNLIGAWKRWAEAGEDVSVDNRDILFYKKGLQKAVELEKNRLPERPKEN